MGYTTEFEGTLKFDCEMTVPMLAKVKSYCGIDGRDIKDVVGDFTYIDLILNDDFSGLIWDSGTEKNRGMIDAVNYIITDMKKTYPNFALKGGFVAKGEEYDDVWTLLIVDNKAIREEIEIKGIKCKCPECGHKFIQE